MCNDAGCFTEINYEDTNTVIVANGNKLEAKGSGDVVFQTETSNGLLSTVTLKSVLYVPGLENNLMSVLKATQNNCAVTFEGNKCKIIKDRRIVIEGQANDNLYEIFAEKDRNEKLANVAIECRNKNCIELWHKRLGHRHKLAIKQLIKDKLADGINIDRCKHINECESCIKGKISEAPYPKEATFRAKQPLDLIHSDICGPMETHTIGGKSYFLTFVDDFSRFTMIYLLSKKSEVFPKFKEYIAVTHNKFGRKIKTLRSDNGGEYVNEKIEQFLKDQGIHHQVTVPYSPSQNGIAERKNRSIMEMTRCMLFEAGLPNGFWGEAVNTATYLQNRLPTKSNNKTPYELWTNRKPNLSHIKIFGCKAFAYINRHKRGKLDEKAVEGTLVGYDNRSKGYRIYTKGNRIIISRTVRFIETKDNCIEIPLTRNQDDIECKKEEEEPSPEIKDVIEIPRRSTRATKGKPPDYFSFIAQTKEPSTYKDIQNLPEIERNKWHEAMKEEIASLEKNETWELVELPKNKKTIGCKWTYKIKRNEEGIPERYKARLVAKGFNQKFGTDYDETFAPVVKHTTLRAFLSTACYKNMHVNHLDVKTAFLHGELQEEIFMEPPEGYTKRGNMVYKLKKAIYGLKQAAKAWNEKIESILTTDGYKQSEADPCLFTKRKNNVEIIIIVYVDDLLIASKEVNEIKKVINMLENNFEIKDLGDVRHYLGITIKRTEEGNFYLNQKIKIEKLYESLDKEDKIPTYTPMKTTYSNDNQETNLLTNNKRYRKAIGILLYISTLTRPDISLAVNLLSRKNENPTEEDWKAVVKVIQYLHNTKDLNLVICKTENPVLKGYSDADWANDKSSRKSTGGNIFFIGKSPISWTTKRQNCVALSSTESEYISAAQAGMEIQWLILLMKDLGLEQSLPVTLYEDNKSCIIISQNSKNNSRTKHIDVKYHYLRQLQKENIVLLEYCNTNSMVADILTKPLPKPQFYNLMDKLNLKALD
jgi:transposase InsO family protein